VNRNHLDEELMLCVFAGQDSLIMRVVTSDSVSAANQYTDEPENPDSSDDTEFWRKGMRTHQNVLIHIYKGFCERKYHKTLYNKVALVN